MACQIIHNIPFVDTVALIVLEDNKILVERRGKNKRTDPGITVIPGGHREPGETLEEACQRELFEELGLKCSKFTFVDTLIWETPLEIQNVHFYHCKDWAGALSCNEADEVLWVGFDELGLIDVPEEREILEKYLK